MDAKEFINGVYLDSNFFTKEGAIKLMEQYHNYKTKKGMNKTWNIGCPNSKGEYICRMFNGYIKMCHWDGFKWLDMKKPTLEGDVKEYMYIPYDELPKTKNEKEVELPEISEYIKRFKKTYSPRTDFGDLALYEGNFTIFTNAMTLISVGENKFKTEIFFREGTLITTYIKYLTATDIVDVVNSLKFINELISYKSASITYNVVQRQEEYELKPLEQRWPLEHLGERKTYWSHWDNGTNKNWSHRDKQKLKKTIKSFVAVGDVIEVIYCGEPQIFTVEKFEVIMNNVQPPTEFVIHVKFSYNGGVSSIECTSDQFKYVRHIKIPIL